MLTACLTANSSNKSSRKLICINTKISGYVDILSIDKSYSSLALSREEREQRDLEQLPKVRRQSSETATSKDIAKAMQDEEMYVYLFLVPKNLFNYFLLLGPSAQEIQIGFLVPVCHNLLPRIT